MNSSANPPTRPNKVGAICIISAADENARNNVDPTKIQHYKVIYTKNCVSQITRYHKAHGEQVKIHLYKYGSRADFEKIKELLAPHTTPETGPKVSLQTKCDKKTGRPRTYLVSLNTILKCFMKHFEPDIESDEDDI